MIVASIEEEEEEIQEVDLTVNMKQIEENIEEETVIRDRIKINPKELEENEIVSRKKRRS